MPVTEIDGREAGIYAQMAHYVRGHPQCGFLHGHSVSLSVTIDGDIDTDYFVADFGEVKKAMRKVLDIIDHKGLVVPMKMTSPSKDGQRILVRFTTDGEYGDFPARQVCVIDVQTTTAELMAVWAGRHLLELLKTQGWRTMTVKYWETRSTCGTWMWMAGD